MAQPTTRRGRFLLYRAKYLYRARRWYYQSWRWYTQRPGKLRRKIGRKWMSPGRGNQTRLTKTSRTYNATPYPDFLVPGWIKPIVISKAGPRRPPHVKFTNAAWPLYNQPHSHVRHPMYSYHKRPVEKRDKRPRDARNTAFNRRVTGCNWFFFWNSCFPDGDVLDRHPNETDIANGAPYSTLRWPDPLGYRPIN